MTRTQPVALTPDSFELAVDTLVSRDRDLARITSELGRPVFWRREAGFATLVLIILEQQVSLASARAAYDRLEEGVGVPTPESLLTLDDDTLRGMGFSRQKTRYCRALAHDLLNGRLDLETVATITDDDARAALMRVMGIGRWTADIYLLCALSRPDIWPVGDLALVAALQQIKALPGRPDAEEMKRLGEPWRPWRSVAAQILWQHYLEGKIRTSEVER